MIFTHDHLDHYDPETAPVFLGERRRPKTVLCPTSVWQKVRALGGPHNYVLFDRHTEWTEHGFRFRAVGAAHSDRFAIGVIVEVLDEGKTLYITGDTLYSREILAELPEGIDVIFLPVNGVGNNMNATDAARFATAAGAKAVVPYHVGMFDEQTPDILKIKNRILPALYEEIEV
jgi:L-ascorbate metabolism protein UlaG (beta-lactamase superfamily)